MSDKLLIEIDLHNGQANDAVRALVFLANELVESSTIEISEPVNWNERSNNDYQVKWRFSEDELHLPLELDFVHQLTDELRQLKKTLSRNGQSAIKILQKQLESQLAENRIGLCADID